MFYKKGFLTSATFSFFVSQCALKKLIYYCSSYASPVDHQITPCASSKGQSDDYDSKPYSESEHSVSSCFTSCK